MAARINLSITDELKARMDNLPDVNWSKVAQQFFETHVQIQELKESNMITEAGIARLRASKESNTVRERADGEAAGKQWALELAEYEQLQRIAELQEVDGVLLTPMELTEAINDDGAATNQETRETMESVTGIEWPSGDFVSGFVSGAIEVFNQI